MANHLQRLVGEIAESYPMARIEFEPLPSGVCFLDVSLGERMFVIEYDPKRGAGVSEIRIESAPFTGHEHGFDSLPAAIVFFKERLAEAADGLSGAPVLSKTNQP